jgi:uncharacterized protein YukJ
VFSGKLPEIDCKDDDAVLYAFGDAYPQGDGSHDIHMNQRNPKQGGHSRDNGIFQDGAVLFQFPGEGPMRAQYLSPFKRRAGARMTEAIRSKHVKLVPGDKT